MGTIHGLGPASPPVIVLSASGELLTPEPITYLLVKLVSIRRMESYFGWSMMRLGGEDDFNGW